MKRVLVLILSVVGLAATSFAQTGHYVGLTWTASVSTNVANYTIWRSTVSGGPYSTIGTVAATVTSYNDTKAAVGQFYCYVAESVDGSGNASAFSNESCATIPLVASTLALSPATVTGGTSSTGTVTLNAPAITSVSVALSSSNTAVATVPVSVTVAAGASSATFAVTTLAVTTSTNVTISASYGGATVNATLTVQPPPLAAPTNLTATPH